MDLHFIVKIHGKSKGDYSLDALKRCLDPSMGAIRWPRSFQKHCLYSGTFGSKDFANFDKYAIMCNFDLTVNPISDAKRTVHSHS